VRQRRWWGKESSAVLTQEIGFPLASLGYGHGYYYPTDGTEAFDIFTLATPQTPAVEYWMIRQPRELYTVCSNGATCNSGGECVSDEPPPSLLMISTPKALK